MVVFIKDTAHCRDMYYHLLGLIFFIVILGGETTLGRLPLRITNARFLDARTARPHCVTPCDAAPLCWQRHRLSDASVCPIHLFRYARGALEHAGIADTDAVVWAHNDIADRVAGYLK